MTDQRPIREVLRNLELAVAHRAAEPPDPSEIYTPSRHANALDPDRVLVIGGRGVGKSFWAAVLASANTRQVAARSYPSLCLDKIDVALGFHDGAEGTSAVAPSPATLKRALMDGADPVVIWRSVLLRAAVPKEGPQKLAQRIEWIERDPEAFEDILLHDDVQRDQKGRKLLVVFDALDRLATDWTTIRTLTQALARLALESRARKAIRIKLFMRPDQFKDLQAGSFTDFSKLSTGRVDLEWGFPDLYGLLFTRLWRDSGSKNAFEQIAESIRINIRGTDLPNELREDECTQQRAFSFIAGAFMGKNAKRGVTYTWLPKHLADAHGETSPRSFLITLCEAASKSKHNIQSAIDFHGINAGVIKASETRLEELREDNPWISNALAVLEGLTVPCDETEILDRWRQESTLQTIKALTASERPAAPIQLERAETVPPERAILAALIDLGVIERRDGSRVNVPDIFRVAAKMKRRGGVAPRKKK